MRKLVLTLVLPFLLGSWPAVPLAAEAGTIAIPERELVDQSNERTDAADALSGDRVTVVSFTFTGCSSICPVSDLVMSGVDRLPGDFRMATLTINPIDDTPEMLARRAGELGASPRWRFYTGNARDVFDVVASLGMDARSLADHPSFFLVIGPRAGSVTRLETSASSDDIRRAIAVASR